MRRGKSLRAVTTFPETRTILVYFLKLLFFATQILFISCVSKS